MWYLTIGIIGFIIGFVFAAIFKVSREEDESYRQGQK